MICEKIYKSTHLPFLSILAEKKNTKESIDCNKTNYKPQINQLDNYQKKILKKFIEEQIMFKKIK